MSASPVPKKTPILVVGGGPAGSTAATLLQREGHQVVLLEATKFPRYHIGESMLPSLRHHLRFVGVEEEFVNHGFLAKPGATYQLVHNMQETWTDFSTLGPECGTWNVIRSEMDDILLRHAVKQGVTVVQETRVASIEFAGVPGSSRPVSAKWVSKSGASGDISFDWLIDASGISGIMSTKYLKDRTLRESLRNIAVWGYWIGVELHGKGTKKEGSGYFEALTDETGWAWVIPLHDGTTSVGVVMHESKSKAKKKQLPVGSTLTDHYLEQLHHLPGVQKLIGDGKFVSGSTKSASDYSYFAERYSGDRFRIVGDAANFVDPFLSSGVHIALTGALSAAITISASIKGEIDERTAQAWHDEKVGIAHTRFLFVVLSAYRQMHLQDYRVLPALSDFTANNFDKAFEMFQPVIFGTADSAPVLTSGKVQNMIDTFSPLFDPSVDESNIMSVMKRYGTDLIKVESPVLGRQKIEEIMKDDKEGEQVLKKIDAVKMFAMDVEVTEMGRHPLLGYRAHVVRGELGLKRLDESEVGARHVTTAQM